MRVWRNWGRTQICRPALVAKPRSEAELLGLLADAARDGHRVKCVGAGHSFTDIACTDGVMIDLSRYDAVVDVDRAAKTITVQSGISIRKLNHALAEHGLAMPNLGDIAYQTISGAISTATHGTGRMLGNLATFVKSMRLLCADGSVLDCSLVNDEQVYRAAQVSLGSLGIISTLTLQVSDAFNLEARESAADLDETLVSLDELVDGNEHFEFFWFPHTTRVYRKANNRTDARATPRSRLRDFRDEVLLENAAFGAAAKVGKARPEWIPAIAQKAVASSLGDRHRVDRSDKIFASTRLVRFAEMEYAIPRSHARGAIETLRRTIDDRGFKVNFPVEFRFVAADDILLSPAHGRQTCYIAVHLYKGMDYQPYFRAVEEIMRSFDGRPHWGKLHFREAADLRPAYPRWDDFAAVRAKLDPDGRFRNPYLDRVLGPPA